MLLSRIKHRCSDIGKIILKQFIQLSCKIILQLFGWKNYKLVVQKSQALNLLCYQSAFRHSSVAEGISIKATLVMDYRPLHVPTLKIVFGGFWRDAGKEWLYICHVFRSAHRHIILLHVPGCFSSYKDLDTNTARDARIPGNNNIQEIIYSNLTALYIASQFLTWNSSW